MEKKEDRKSNIELLRIIAMIFIVSYHYIYYNANQTQIIFNNYFVSLGALGNDIFMIISGYFLINKEFKSKRIIRFWLQIVFYSIILFIFSIIYFKVGNFNFISIVKAMMPITYNTYWFATVYFFIYLLSPIINKTIKSIKKEHLSMILILVLILSLLPNILNDHFFILNGIGSFGIMLYMYIIGAYINLYGIKILEKMKKISCICAIIAIYSFLTIIVNVWTNTNYNNIAQYVREIDSIFVIAIAILMFYLFSKINIKSNRIINKIASSSFAVYLIHENPVYRIIFWKNYFILTENVLLDINMLIISETFIFFIAVCLETIRKNLFEKNFINRKFLVRLEKKIDKNMQIDD